LSSRTYFLRHGIENENLKGNLMAKKPNYGFEKRQKELAKKAKKEEKKQAKLAEKQEALHESPTEE